MAGEKIKIQLLAEAGTLSELTALCAPLGIEHCTESPLALVQTETHLCFLGDVDDEHRGRGAVHVADTAQLLVELVLLALEQEEL